MSDGDIGRAVEFVGPKRVEAVSTEEPVPALGDVVAEASVSAVSAGSELLAYRGELGPETVADETEPTLQLLFTSLADAADRYRDETLNDQLKGNPTAERLARTLFEATATSDAPAATEPTVTLREDDVASVAYTGEIR
ncbi:hypothetical protein ABNG03_08320 [Halorubrum sp. RMP-47]|uniref:Uncharacterized protein n=1 Tax=Halorubrum miltondacostae TaxID=3076378 RepID=A0ABD5M405_9EURY